jgi:O-antigen/teichoic acid export membrane protein
VFSLMTLLRSVATIAVRLVLVMVAGMGISGLYLADLLVTLVTLAVLARWFVPLIKPLFSRAILRETLAFGLPRLPHAAAQQIMAVGDKFILKLFVSLDNVGVYGVSVSFGLMQKLFLSAFQSAWAPFIFDTARDADAPPIFRTVTTYGVAVLALLTAGLSAVGRDTVAAMTHGRLLAPDDPRWAEVQTVITWTAIGVFLQGFYLLTSIGLNITKRTQYYPVATIAAASSNVALNFLLIPRFGIVGAAYANGAGYAVQALLGFIFSQRFYQIDYEWTRLARICAAAVFAAAGARALPSIHMAGVDPRSIMAALPDVGARGAVVIIIYIALLAVGGVLHRDELARLRRLRPRRRTGLTVATAPDATEAGGTIGNADLPLMPDTVKVQDPRE